MNPYEQTLQIRAEAPDDGDADLTAADQAEVVAYRVVFAALTAEPDFRLPHGFAETVANCTVPAREPLWPWLGVPAAVLLPLGVAAVLVPETVAALVRELAPIRAAVTSIPLPLIASVLFTLATLLLADRWMGPRLLEMAP